MHVHEHAVWNFVGLVVFKSGCIIVYNCVSMKRVRERLSLSEEGSWV